MTIATYDEIMSTVDVSMPGHLTGSDSVPVVFRFGVQGDVYFRREPLALPKDKGILAHRINVVEGDVIRNAHILHCPSGIWYPGIFVNDLLDFGAVKIPEGEFAYLIHTGEHGAVAFAPGSWRLWGQLSFERELRRVAD